MDIAEFGQTKHKKCSAGKTLLYIYCTLNNTWYLAEENSIHLLADHLASYVFSSSLVFSGPTSLVLFVSPIRLSIDVAIVEDLLLVLIALDRICHLFVPDDKTGASPSSLTALRSLMDWLMFPFLSLGQVSQRLRVGRP